MGLIQDILSKYNQRWIAQIQVNLERTGANATGKTAASLRGIASDSRMQLFGARAFNPPVIPTASGRASIEVGSPKGTFVATSDLIEWARAKGIPLYLIPGIQRSIAARGTKTVNEDKPRNIYSNVINADSLAPMYRELAGVFVKEVRSDLVQSFKQAA